MCKYCEKMKSFHYDRSNAQVLEVYIEPDKTLTINTWDSNTSINIKINYCPMCGEELVKDMEKNVIESDEKESICCPDYEVEYYRQQGIIHLLTEENEKLKKALMNLALKM